MLEIDGQNLKIKSRSLDNLNEETNEEVQGIFLTETRPVKNFVDMKKLNMSSQSMSSINKISTLQMKQNEAEKQKWDYHLIDLLSESTARWIAMKDTTDCINS